MLAARLRSLRKEKNLTQDQVGKILGMSRARYAHYENERAEPSKEVLDKLADYYGTTVEYLYGRTDNRMPSVEDKLDLEKVLKSPNVTYKGMEIPAEDLKLFNDLADRILEHLEKKKH